MVEPQQSLFFCCIGVCFHVEEVSLVSSVTVECLVRLPWAYTLCEPKPDPPEHWKQTNTDKNKDVLHIEWPDLSSPSEKGHNRVTSRGKPTVLQTSLRSVPQLCHSTGSHKRGVSPLLYTESPPTAAAEHDSPVYLPGTAGQLTERRRVGRIAQTQLLVLSALLPVPKQGPAKHTKRV